MFANATPATGTLPMVLVGCLVWLPLGIWVISLVQWAIQGEMDAVLAFFAICATLGLGIACMFPPFPGLQPFLLAVVLVMTFGFPGARAAFQRHQLAMADIEAIERVYEHLQKDPDNLGARLRLARTLNTRGLRAMAISLAEHTLRDVPKRLFDDEFKMLAKWKVDSQPSGPVTCMDCNQRNEPAYVFCITCGAPFLLDHARGRWLGVKLARKLISIWAALVIPTVGIAMALRYFPGALVLPSALVLIAMAGAAIWIGFKREAKLRL